MGRGLVVMHIDGLGADSCEEGLREGDTSLAKIPSVPNAVAEPRTIAVPPR